MSANRPDTQQRERVVHQQRNKAMVVDRLLCELEAVNKGFANTEEFSHAGAKAERQRRLSNVGSLSEAYGNFGHGGGDRVKKRDQVLMFKDIRSSMEVYLERFIRDGLYDSAIDLRDRMKKVTKEFREDALAQEAHLVQDQCHMLRKARGKVLSRLRAQWRAHLAQAEQSCKSSHAALRETHKVQKEVLERNIAHAPSPRIKWSTTVLDFEMTERSLCKQFKFEEAKEIRRRCDALKARETTAHDCWVAQEEEHLRQQQRERHVDETETRKSNCKTLMWTTRRQAQLDGKTTKWRMDHVKADMTHAHAMDGIATRKFLGPQMMSIRPLNPRRKGHEATGAALHGMHMQAATAEGRAAVTGLTESHDFGDIAHAVTLDRSEGVLLDVTGRRAAATFGLKQGSLGGQL